MNRKYNDDVIYLCKLPAKQLLEKVYGKIVNDDVVLTKERQRHIEERRKGDADFVKIHLIETIKDYDYIVDAEEGCVKFLKSFENSKNAVVVWLSLSRKEQANSVLTGERINKRELNRLLKNKGVIDNRIKKI